VPSAAPSASRLPAAAAGLSVPLAALAGAGALGLLALALPPPPPAASKPHSTFAAFYRRQYLPEHSKQATKRLHFVGTLLMLGQVAAAPALGLAMACGGLVGAALFPMLRGQRTGAVEMAGMLATYAYVGAALTGSPTRTALVPLSAYGLAWAGHFFVEKNRPATFVYPSFSLLGDLRMFSEMLLGPLSL